MAVIQTRTKLDVQQPPRNGSLNDILFEVSLRCSVAQEEKVEWKENGKISIFRRARFSTTVFCLSSHVRLHHWNLKMFWSVKSNFNHKCHILRTILVRPTPVMDMTESSWSI